MLYERICRSINYLSTTITNSTSLWDGPIDMCQQIEADQMAVDSVIVEAKKRNSYFNGFNTPRLYHAILCRVYMLLYYKHRDDKLYQSIVFPRLMANMGVYSDVHIKTVNAKIDEILEQEKLIEQMQAEKKKAMKPKFIYPTMEQAERDALFDEYNDERLFREFIEFCNDVIRPNNFIPDYAMLWYAAKDVVRKLWQASYPESYIDRILHNFDSQIGYRATWGPQLVMIGVYAMMRTVEGEHFAKAIQQIEGYRLGNTDYHALYENIESVKQWIDKTSPFDNYDYTGAEPDASGKETFVRADIERISTQYTAMLEEQKKKTAELEKQMAVKDTEIKRLKYEYGELEKQKQMDDQQWAPLTPEEQLGIDERIIFFSSALRIDLTDNDANQTGLARFICSQTGSAPESVRPRINKIAQMYKAKQIDGSVADAAKNVTGFIAKCWKSDKLSEAAYKIVEDIELYME